MGGVFFIVVEVNAVLVLKTVIKIVQLIVVIVKMDVRDMRVEAIVLIHLDVQVKLIMIQNMVAM